MRPDTKSGGGGVQFASGPIRKVGGGAVCFKSDTKSGGGGGGGAVRFRSDTKSGGGGGGSLLQVRYEKWGPLFGAQQIRYR